LLAFHHTSSPQEVGTCPQATYPPPTDRYEPPGYTPSPNRPVRAPGLHTLPQQTGTSSLGVPPPPTDRYEPPGYTPSPNRSIRAPRLARSPHRPARAAPSASNRMTLSCPFRSVGGGGGTEYCPGGEGLAWGHVSICWERVFSLGARTGLLGEGGTPKLLVPVCWRRPSPGAHTDLLGEGV
jgi:hypothetical protein